MSIGRKKKEAIEPEIVSIAPAENAPSEKAIALKQRTKQLEAISKDLDEFLPVVQSSRQAMVEIFFEAMKQATEDEEFKDQMIKWIIKHPKDATAAISTLNAVAGTIVHPQQLQAGGKKRIRLMFGKDQGVEILE